MFRDNFDQPSAKLLALALSQSVASTENRTEGSECVVKVILRFVISFLWLLFFAIICGTAAGQPVSAS